MRELDEFETMSVSGAGFGDEFAKVLNSLKTIKRTDIKNFSKEVFEGSVDSMSYIMGRVAGDLHPSYYQ